MLSFVMVLSVFCGMTITAWATTKTATDSIKWVKSKVGTSIDFDGSYGSQCVDLVMAYYNYLGVAISHGNGCDYASNTLPSGWTRKKEESLVKETFLYGLVVVDTDMLQYTNRIHRVIIKTQEEKFLKNRKIFRY